MISVAHSALSKFSKKIAFLTLAGRVIFKDCLDGWNCIFAVLELLGVGHGWGKLHGALFHAEERMQRRTQAEAEAIAVLYNTGHVRVIQQHKGWHSDLKIRA